MINLVCEQIRRSKFIDRDIVFDIRYDDAFSNLKRIEKSVKLRKEFKDLGVAFCLNRVELRFTCDYATSQTHEWSDMRDRIKNFCDTKLEGYWTWKIKSRSVRDQHQKYLYEMDLFFELKEDMDLWLKEQGLILRLSL